MVTSNLLADSLWDYDTTSTISVFELEDVTDLNELLSLSSCSGENDMGQSSSFTAMMSDGRASDCSAGCVSEWKAQELQLEEAVSSGPKTSHRCPRSDITHQVVHDSPGGAFPTLHRVNLSEAPVNATIPERPTLATSLEVSVPQPQEVSDPLADGYSWRKYGMKTAKGARYPRSYFKCSLQFCPALKTVERSKDGITTQIIYKHEHNHEQHQGVRRLCIRETDVRGPCGSEESSDDNGGHQKKSRPTSSASEGNWQRVATDEVATFKLETPHGDMKALATLVEEQTSSTPAGDLFNCVKTHTSRLGRRSQSLPCTGHTDGQAVLVESPSLSLPTFQGEDELSTMWLRKNPPLNAIAFLRPMQTAQPPEVSSEDFRNSPADSPQKNRKRKSDKVAVEETQTAGVPSHNNENPARASELWDELPGDGYRWKKYGQKPVKGSEHPRSYFRCSLVGCPAQKRLQRSDAEPAVLLSTYVGEHNHSAPFTVSTLVTGSAAGAASQPHDFQYLFESWPDVLNSLDC